MLGELWDRWQQPLAVSALLIALVGGGTGGVVAEVINLVTLDQFQDAVQVGAAFLAVPTLAVSVVATWLVLRQWGQGVGLGVTLIVAGIVFAFVPLLLASAGLVSPDTYARIYGGVGYPGGPSESARFVVRVVEAHGLAYGPGLVVGALIAAGTIIFLIHDYSEYQRNRGSAS